VKNDVDGARLKNRQGPLLDGKEYDYVISRPVRGKSGVTTITALTAGHGGRLSTVLDKIVFWRSRWLSKKKQFKVFTNGMERGKPSKGKKVQTLKNRTAGGALSRQEPIQPNQGGGKENKTA